MQKIYESGNAVLFYFIILIIISLNNIIRELCIVDIIYLITLFCALIKYILLTNN